MAVHGWIAVQLVLALIGYATSFEYKIGAMYGANTHEKDLYKNLFTDASVFINRDRELSNDGRDRISIYNYAPVGGIEWALPNTPQALRAACTFASSVDLHGLIIPSDMCPNCGGHTGRIVGDAFSPVIALDQAEGSNAYKMLMTDSDLMDLWISVINHYKWQDFIFIYDGDSAYSVALMLMAMEEDNDWHIVPYEISEDWDVMAKDLKKRRIQNYLLYVHEEELLPDLRDWMLDSGMFGDKYHWIFGNMEPPISRNFLDDKLRIHTSFLTRFKMETVFGVDQDVHTRNPIPPRKWPFRQRTAYDSMVFMAKAVMAYHAEWNRWPEAVPKCGEDIVCDLDPTMQKISHEGLSGEVAFNENRDRVNYTINIFMGKDKHNILQAGRWTQNIDHYERKKGVKWPEGKGRLDMFPFRQSDQGYIKILSIEEPPFMMLKDRDYTRETRQVEENDGLDRYIGYIPELLQHVKRVFEEDMHMEFKYRIELVSEGYYGKRNPNTGEWDGLVKELQDSDADLAAAAFTVTRPREEVIDFSKHFVKSNIMTLMKHPNWRRDFPFNFAFSFHWDTWLVNLFALGIAILAIWLIMRYHPLEYRRQAATGNATQEQADSYTLRNSAWTLVCIMFWQGHKSSPKSYSGRIMLATWFFFCIVMLFLFMLNLSDFIVIDKTILFINDPVDLLNEPLLKIGMVRDSPTHNYYSMSTNPDDQQLMTLMGVLDRAPFVQKLRDGALRVRNDNGHYALVSEEIMLSFYTQKGPWCDLYIAGDPVKKIKFAFATPSGSPLRDQITYVMNKLGQEGVLQDLAERRWFGDQKCENETIWEEESLLSINANDLEGIYYVLAMGVVLSVIIFFIDVLSFWQYGSCSNSGTQLPPTGQVARRNRQGDNGIRLTDNPSSSTPPPVRNDGYDYGAKPTEKSPNLWI
ncbi:glutamate receptor 1-like [Asterias rubens]|uniref:glutamate receptor 1-like n=1 Tax=Asterias rubens TaxID=7604 RepID=UPI0014555A1E|nr:glutamate receptor 1-like [Asterias rubens]